MLSAMSTNISTACIIHSHNMLLLICLWGLKMRLRIFILASHNVVTTATWSCSDSRTIVNIASRAIYVAWYGVCCRSCGSARRSVHCSIKSMSVWIVLSQVEAATDLSSHPTHTWNARCSCHASTAAVNIILRRPKVEIALVALSICHLIWCKILMLVVIGLILGRRRKLMMTVNFIVLGNLLWYLILVLAHGTSGLIIVLLCHFHAIPLVLHRPDVVTNVAHAVAKLAEI